MVAAILQGAFPSLEKVTGASLCRVCKFRIVKERCTEHRAVST